MKKQWIAFLMALVMCFVSAGIASAAEDSGNANINEIEEQTLYDSNGIKIIAKEMLTEDDSIDVKIYIENNSDRNLGFNAHAYAINGIMTGNNIYDMDCNVAAGKKANTRLKLRNEVLDYIGISQVDCVDVLFWAYDNAELMKAFEAGPFEITTATYPGMHSAYSGEPLWEENGIEVEYLGQMKDAYYIIVNNKTGSYLDFDFADISINDYTVTDYLWDLQDVEVFDSCQSIVAVPVEDSFMEENDIDEVTALEWYMEIRPKGDYSSGFRVGPIVCDLTQMQEDKEFIDAAEEDLAEIAGLYHATYSMKDVLNKELEEAGMQLESALNADFLLELGEDGSFSFDIDGAGFLETLTETMEKEGPGMIRKMLEEEGIPEDMYDMVAAASGYDNIDAFIDDMVKSMIDELGDTFAEDLEAEVHYEGKYSVNGDTIDLVGIQNGNSGFDHGTINEDGSIYIRSKMEDGIDLELTLTREA